MTPLTELWAAGCPSVGAKDKGSLCSIPTVWLHDTGVIYGITSTALCWHSGPCLRPFQSNIFAWYNLCHVSCSANPVKHSKFCSVENVLGRTEMRKCSTNSRYGSFLSLYNEMLGSYLPPSHLCFSVTILLISLLWISIHKQCNQVKRWESPRDRQEEAARSFGPAPFSSRGMPKPSFTFAQEWFHFLRKEWELDMCGLVSLSLGFIPKFNSGTWKGRIFDLWTVRTSAYVANASSPMYIPARPKRQTMSLNTSPSTLLIEESS